MPNLPDCLAATGDQFPALLLIGGVFALAVGSALIIVARQRRSVAGQGTTTMNRLSLLAVAPILLGALLVFQAPTGALAATSPSADCQPSSSSVAPAAPAETPAAPPAPTPAPPVTPEPEPEPEPLVTVTPVSPTLVPAVCVDSNDVEPTVTIDDTEGVTYSQTRDGNILTITAAADEGYAFAEGAVTSWQFDLTPLDCNTQGGNQGGGDGGGQ